MKTIVIFLSITMASGALATNVYNSIVDATSWGAHIPESIEAARSYFSKVNPGTFYRVMSPVNQLLALVALVLFWKLDPTIRLTLGVALACYVLTDVFTFGYFYPRNAIMFDSTSDIETLQRAWSGWSTMNWWRSALILIGVFFSCYSLHKIYMKLAV